MKQMAESFVANGHPDHVAPRLPVSVTGEGDAMARDEHAALSQRLADLGRLFTSTRLALDHTSASMRESGLPPDFHLVSALAECHRQFLRLRVDVTRYISSLGDPRAVGSPATTLNDLGAWLDPPQRLPAPVPPPLPVMEPIPPLDASTEPSHAPASRPETAPRLTPRPPAPFPSHASLYQGLLPDDVPSTEAWDEFDALLPKGRSLPDTVSVDAVEPHHLPESYLETVPLDSFLEPEPPPPEAPRPGDLLRATALTVLDRVLTLTTRDGPDLEPLNHALNQAEALRDRILTSPHDDLPADSLPLATGTHPFVGLLRVIDGAEELSDAQWSDLHASITEAFGRPFAVAAARGRLTFRDSPSHA